MGARQRRFVPARAENGSSLVVVDGRFSSSLSVRRKGGGERKSVQFTSLLLLSFLYYCLLVKGFLSPLSSFLFPPPACKSSFGSARLLGPKGAKGGKNKRRRKDLGVDGPRQSAGRDFLETIFRLRPSGRHGKKGEPTGNKKRRRSGRIEPNCPTKHLHSQQQIISKFQDDSKRYDASNSVATYSTG